MLASWRGGERRRGGGREVLQQGRSAERLTRPRRRSAPFSTWSGTAMQELLYETPAAVPDVRPDAAAVAALMAGLGAMAAGC